MMLGLDDRWLPSIRIGDRQHSLNIKSGVPLSDPTNEFKAEVSLEVSTIGIETGRSEKILKVCVRFSEKQNQGWIQLGPEMKADFSIGDE
jgi:hypothetical protein